MVTTKNLILDPKGYFIIRLHEGKVEIGFCSYKDMVWGKSNTVISMKASKDPEVLLKWVRDEKLYTRQDHYDYLVRELNSAKKCLETGEKYVQD